MTSTYVCVKAITTTVRKDKSRVRQLPLYAGGIWIRSLISTVRPTVHTNPSRKRSFSETLFEPENLKIPAFHYRVSGKQLDNRAFRKQI